MNVNELIQKLQELPEHYVVVVDDDALGFYSEIRSVHCVDRCTVGLSVDSRLDQIGEEIF